MAKRVRLSRLPPYSSTRTFWHGSQNWSIRCPACAQTSIPSKPAGPSPAFSKIYDILAAMQERVIRSNANVDEELATAQKQSQDLLDQAITSYPDLYKGS